MKKAKITNVAVENLGIDGLESVLIRMEIPQDAPMVPLNKTFVWKPLLQNGKANYGFGKVFALLSLQEKKMLKRLQAEYAQKGTRITLPEALRAYVASGDLNEWLKDREIMAVHQKTLADNGKTYEEWQPEPIPSTIDVDNAMEIILSSRKENTNNLFANTSEANY